MLSPGERRGKRQPTVCLPPAAPGSTVKPLPFSQMSQPSHWLLRKPTIWVGLLLLVTKRILINTLLTIMKARLARKGASENTELEA